MRSIYLCFVFFYSLSIFAQEGISASYLDSLPEDIRKDVIKRIEDKGAREEVVYRASDFSSEVARADIETEIFGSKFFDTMQTSFMPINNPNLDDTYVLDSGDVLNIQLTGQKDSIEDYKIERDGSINILDIGKLYLAGLNLNQVTRIINERVNETFIGTEAFITLKYIRDVSVLVAGDAFNPGIYTLNGNSNILHAIHAAGGISEFGSYRTINLIRDSKVIDTIDIYNILIEGKFKTDVRLRSGDIIFVEPRQNVITLEGAFKRVAKYELLQNQNLSDVISYANGLSIDADLSNIFLYRLLDGQVKAIEITNISQLNNIKGIDEDRLFIRKHSFRDVSIKGAVVRPGSYKMIEGETVFDLIYKAGGYTPNAFPAGAIYLNTEAKRINREASTKLYQNFLDGLLELLQKSSSSQIDIGPLLAIAEDIKSSEPNGRIVVDLLDDNSEIVLREDDELIIPEKNNNVFIFGEVSNQGSLIYKYGANLDFYVREASGYKETADVDSVFILYPNGRTKQFNIKRNLFASQSQKISIEPGSVIYVPREIDDSLSSILAAQAYATILGNIGITVASLKSIND